jgi:(1->4)-alpha-D-glucan 1-alpha-D-glucosylmutase
MVNSLSWTFLKMVAPGVPDFYQGTELWDFSFVDPDNRRAVDYDCRRTMLNNLKLRESQNRSGLLDELLSTWKDGRVKLYLTYKMLNFRRQHKDIFLEGIYIPLEVDGDLQEHVCAFARQLGEEWVVAVVPRLTVEIAPSGSMRSFAEAWGTAGIILPEAAPDVWRNVLTGEQFAAGSAAQRRVLPLHDLFAHFPLTLLSSDSAPAPSLPAESQIREEVRSDLG